MFSIEGHNQNRLSRLVSNGASAVTQNLSLEYKANAELKEFDVSPPYGPGSR
jgi:hypothetical protein